MMNRYQFEQIPRRMEKKYGKVQRGQEERYALILFPMESNLLKVNRTHPASHSQRLLEAIPLALCEVERHITGESRDVSQFENEDNLRLKHALLMAFDPYTNPEIREHFEEITKVDLSNPASVKKYYQVPIMCILRIWDSVNLMIKKHGSNGYFEFLEMFMGSKVKSDKKMNYGIPIDPEMGINILETSKES